MIGQQLIALEIIAAPRSHIASTTSPLLSSPLLSLSLSFSSILSPVAPRSCPYFASRPSIACPAVSRYRHNSVDRVPKLAFVSFRVSWLQYIRSLGHWLRADDLRLASPSFPEFSCRPQSSYASTVRGYCRRSGLGLIRGSETLPSVTHE